MPGPGESIDVSLSDVIELRLFSKFQNQVAVNVLHYIVTEVTNTFNLGDIAISADNHFVAVMKAVIAAAARWEGVYVQRIHPLPITAPAWFTATAGVGSQIGDVLPKQTSGLIKKITLVASRSTRGRMYVPFPTEDSNDADSSPSGPYSALLGALATALRAPLEIPTPGGADGILTPVVWSRKTRTPQEVVSTIAHGAWATQRRRGDFGRENQLPFAGLGG